MQTILVLGSKGFLGSHIKDYFSSQGREVIGSDRLELKEDNYYRLDDSLSGLKDILLDRKPDICINAAGSGLVSLSIENPDLDFNQNYLLVQRTLESIRQHGPSCRLVHISSAAVYGNPEICPIPESAKIQPISPYGWHKYQSELLCQEYYACFGVNSAIVRPFSVFGPRLKKQFFWDLYTKCMRNASNVPLFGTGHESRDFIHVEDLCVALDCVVTNDGFNAQPINVANGIEVTIAEAVRQFVQAFPLEVNIQFTGISNQGFPINWKADISKLKSYGYKQTVSFESGIKSYIEWLKEIK